MLKIKVLHGPNLNLLGSREPELYGNLGLDQINHMLYERANNSGIEVALEILQSNAEHELLEAIHVAQGQGVDFIIFNPAGLTHTSVVLRDALLAVKIPFIEVHLSNPYAREVFRQRSYFSDIAAGVIVGLGGHGYALALEAAIARFQT